MKIKLCSRNLAQAYDLISRNFMEQKAEKLVIENEDVAKGLIELIASHGITKLVMGAAAEKNYKRCV